MTGSTRGGFYLKLRRWVDRQFQHPRGYPQLLIIPPMPFMCFALMLDGWRVGPDAPGLYSALAIAAAWFCFIGWRSIRAMRALALKRDRKFDRQGRLTLPPEYRNTQSATQARQRR